MAGILHLTPSGVVGRVVMMEMKMKKISARSACFFEPMVVELVGQ